MIQPALRRASARQRIAAPIRIVHLGLGNFFRAHQAFYTDLAPDAGDWGIAAFGGRSSGLAQQLAAQDGLYTLITRAPEGDQFDVFASISATHAADDEQAWRRYFGSPDLACITITVTEAGYSTRPDGRLDFDAEDVQRDRNALLAADGAALTTTPGRLVAGLIERRAVGGGPLAIVSCDNLPANGAVVGGVVRDLAAQIDGSLLDWIAANVSFPNSMVDRITPQATVDDLALVAAATGFDDSCPVVTESFREWVLAGEFPAGRPDWSAAGATIAADIAPHEQRKLRLLNGAHSLLAYAGLNRGLATIYEAAHDDECREWVDRWWAEAAIEMLASPAEIHEYCTQLAERWENRRMEHRSTQIAGDGSQKLAARVLPVVRRHRATGSLPLASIAIIGAWIAYLGQGPPVASDTALPRLAPLLDGAPVAVARAVLDVLDPGPGAERALSDDDELVQALADALVRESAQR